MMLKRVENYVSKWDMLKEGDKIIVGVSGGADSVCLLFVLLELQKKIPFEIVVVHVNHNLRGVEADADETYVKNICEEQGIPCVVYSEDVSSVAREQKQSLEEAGREVRRNAFERAMETYGANKIALAHHLNDSVETFLMNAARGSGIKGLGGIRPVIGIFIRPLLCLERNEVETFLREREINYCIDRTNDSDYYTRNRVRNHVIPYMEREVNLRTVAHIGETMRQLQDVQKYLEEQAKKTFEDCVKQKEKGYIVLEEPFYNVAEVLRPLVVKQVLVNICQKEKDIGEVHIQSICKLLENQVGRHVDLPYGMYACRIYEGILIDKKEMEKEQKPIKYIDLKQGGMQEFFWGDKKIICELVREVPNKEEREQKTNTKWFDYDIITEDVCIRTRQAGDYITIHPDGRTQKLKSFFVNEKVPQKLRDEILLVAEGNHVLWIEGMRTSSAYQIGEQTKNVLKIQVDKGESHERNN